MADERLRVLERAAAIGGEEEQRAFLCYSIGKLQVEADLKPTLMKKVGRGCYGGQTLWHSPEIGITHPCVKWQTDNEEQFWDVVSEDCVWKRPTRMMTVALHEYTWPTSLGMNPSQPVVVVGTPGPGEPGIMEAFRNASLGENIPVLESRWVPEDQILVINPQTLSPPQVLRPLVREYPAKFEDHCVDEMRRALLTSGTPREQGDEDEAEG